MGGQWAGEQAGRSVGGWVGRWIGKLRRGGEGEVFMHSIYGCGYT